MTRDDMAVELANAAVRVGVHRGSGLVFDILGSTARMLDSDNPSVFGKMCALKSLRGLTTALQKDGRTLIEWERDDRIKHCDARSSETIRLAYSLAEDAIADVIAALEAE